MYTKITQFLSISLLLIALSIANSNEICAQSLSTQPVAKENLNSDRAVNFLTEKLSLSQKQSKQVGSFIVSAKSEADKAKENLSDQPTELRSEVQSIVKSLKNNINSILTEEQKEKFSQLQSNSLLKY